MKGIAVPQLLAGLRVGISGSVPEREHWGDVKDLDRLILAFVSQLSSLVVKYGGQVVHGTHPSFVPVIAEQASQWRERPARPLTLFASQLFGDMPEVAARWAPVANAAVLMTPKVGEGTATDTDTRNRSLTAMRMAMTAGFDVLIAIGGKLHAGTGINPGVLEELAHARWRDAPCFVVGAFGGAAASLPVPVLEHLSEGNGLTLEESLSLAQWSDRMDEHVGRLVLHLADHKEEFVKRQPSFTDLADFKYLSRGLRQQIDNVAGNFLDKGVCLLNIDIPRVKKASERVEDLRKALESSDTWSVNEILRAGAL